MTTPMLRPILSAAAFATLLVILPAAEAQIAGGADRYVGTTQQSLNRTNAAMGSIGSVNRIGGMGANAYGTSAMQSVSRTTAAIRSIQANQDAAMRGRQQQVIYRTPDNLYGVYWQNYYANRARLFATQMPAMSFGNPWLTSFPTLPRMTRAGRLQQLDAVRRNAQQSERGRELSQRFEQRSNPSPPGTPAPQFDTIQRELGDPRLAERPLPSRTTPVTTTVAPTPVPTIFAPTPVPTRRD